jgi:hypothetical protein
MKADSVPARSDAGDGYKRRRYRRYTCTGWKQNRDCSMDFLRAELVEQAVFDFLAEQVLLPEHLLQVLQDAQPDDGERRVLEQDAQLLTVTLADVEQVISRLVDAIERSGHSASLAERLAEREAERSRVRVQLSEVQHRLEETKVDVPKAVLEDFCDHAREALQHGALEDVRAVLHSMVVRVEAEQGGGRLVYNFPFVVGL